MPFAASRGDRIGPRSYVHSDSIEPMPVNCTGASCSLAQIRSAARATRPRARSRRHRRFRCEHLGQSPASPAAIVSTLLLNVPACGSASGRRGSNRSMMSARPPNAPNDMPPPMYLPSVVRSGLNLVPVAARPAQGATSSPRPGSAVRRPLWSPRAAWPGTPAQPRCTLRRPLPGGRLLKLSPPGRLSLYCVPPGACAAARS